MYLVCSRATIIAREKLAQFIGLHAFPTLHHRLRVIITFLLVSFAWIFFRAANINDAIYISSHLFTGGWNKIYEFFMDNYLDSLAAWTLRGANSLIILSAILIGPFVLRILRKTKQHGGLRHLLLYGPWLPLRWITYFALIWGILLFGPPPGELHEFIYFTF